MKKLLSIVLAALLVIGVFAGCANQAPLPEKTNTPAQAGELSSKQTAAPTGKATPTDTSAAYAKLIAYKTEDYSRQSLADFNAALASTPEELTEFLSAVADVTGTISPDDENYDFFATTISLSDHELYCEHMGEEVAFFIDLSKLSRLCDYLDEDGQPVYEFVCFVELTVPYSIVDPKLVTVAERDNAFLTLKEEMQRCLNGLSEEEIAGGNLKTMLTNKSAELAKSLSTGGIKLSPCEIYMIEISGVAEEGK